MNSEAGREVNYALAILLQGASALVEQHSLTREPDNKEKCKWRKAVFSSRYWIRPFGSLDKLRLGLMQRVQDLGGQDLGQRLDNLMAWLEGPEFESFPLSSEDCQRLDQKILRPALESCCEMSNGNLP